MTVCYGKSILHLLRTFNYRIISFLWDYSRDNTSLLFEVGNIWVMLGFLHIAVQKTKTAMVKTEG